MDWFIPSVAVVGSAVVIWVLVTVETRRMKKVVGWELSRFVEGAAHPETLEDVVTFLTKEKDLGLNILSSPALAKVAGILKEEPKS